MKKFFIRLVLLVILLIVVGTFLILFFGIDSKPLLFTEVQLSSDDVDRLKQQWEEHDPRKLLPGQIKHLVLIERDVNLLLYYGASQISPQHQIEARLEFYPDAASFGATLSLPFQLFGRYLNISGMVMQRADEFVIKELSLGDIKVPQWLGNALVHFAYRSLQQIGPYKEYTEIVSAVKEFRLQQGRVLLVYQWQQEILEHIQAQRSNLLLPEHDRERLRVYNTHLAKLTQALPGQSASLSALLPPLFNLALQRTRSGQDPVAENQILLLLLALYVNNRTARDLVKSDDMSADPIPRQVSVTLLGREDLVKHFLISAVLATSIDSRVADTLGVFKEIDDSQGGSGFSFADLAADRAGVRLAETATMSPQEGQRLQQRMSRVRHEAEFMPDITNLPEGIMALELRQQYGDLDSEAYRMVHAEIERRIAACWIYP